MYRKTIGFFLLLAVLTTSAQAEELYIRNRLFKGQVANSGGQRWLELKPLAKAMKWTLVGDEQSGYALSSDGSAEAPGAGKVTVAGTEVATRNDGVMMVSLDEIAPLVGAKVVVNKELGTVDVALVKRKDSMTGADRIGMASYTLLEFAYPEEKRCQDVKATVLKARQRFKNMQYIYVDMNKLGASKPYMKFNTKKQFPVTTLVNANGEILSELAGTHIIQDLLLPELRKFIKSR